MACNCDSQNIRTCVDQNLQAVTQYLCIGSDALEMSKQRDVPTTC